MRRNGLRKQNRRKALKTIGGVSLATVGFSGSALASDSESDSETPGEINVVSNTDDKIVMEAEYKDETLQITYFKKGPKAEEVHYEGGQQTLDDTAIDTSTPSPETTPEPTAAGGPDAIEKSNNFKKTIGSCSVYNGYQHRYWGTSFKLSKTADAFGKPALTTAIGAILPGYIALAAGYFAGVILNLAADTRSYTIGQRDFETSGNDLNVAIAATEYNAPIGATFPTGQPKAGHLER